MFLSYLERLEEIVCRNRCVLLVFVHGILLMFLGDLGKPCRHCVFASLRLPLLVLYYSVALRALSAFLPRFETIG